MSEVLISVIIPVYNVEKYLEKCVESVIEQTYTNLEIILVDDGSTDSSGKMCDELATHDKRIRVIHKENGGLADARNAALDIFTGEYVTCIDSDDYVTKDYIEYLFSILRSNDADVAICQLKKIYYETDKLDSIDEVVEVLDGIVAMENYLYKRKFTASAHCKLYKRYLFKEIRYPVGYYYEDMAIICSILALSSRVVISNQQKYYYIQRGDSIMGESFNPKKMHRIKIAEDIRSFVAGEYPELNKAAENRCFLAAVQTYREVPLTDEFSNDINKIWETILQYRSGVLRDRKAKRSIRLIALSTYGGKKILKSLGRLYTKLN